MDKVVAEEILNILEKTFPDAKPELEFSSNYELLVAVILSAQCTDKRVNLVTRELFKEYNTPQKMITLSWEELAIKIKSCGLNNSKAKHILSASNDILQNFNGQVPNSLQELKSLAGVGQKTANVVYSVAFNGNAIAVDTHVFRVSNRIGFSKGNTPIKVEEDLKKVIKKERWAKAHHLLIFLGRRICSSRNPKCDLCPIGAMCKKRNVCR